MFAMSWKLFIKVRMFWYQSWTEQYRFYLSCQNVPFHHKIVTIYLPESETYFYRLFVTPPAHILLPCQTFSFLRNLLILEFQTFVLIFVLSFSPQQHLLILENSTTPVVENIWPSWHTLLGLPDFFILNKLSPICIVCYKVHLCSTEKGFRAQ